jgi:Xaa-Pro aminopeptidase
MNVPRQEIRERKARLQEHLRAQGLQGVIILDGHNFTYFSGYHADVQLWERPIALVIPATGPSTAIVNELSTHGWQLAQEGGLVAADRMIVYHEHPRIAKRGPLLPEWPQLVTQVSREFGILRILGSDNAEFATRVFGPKFQVEDISPVVRDMRLIKSPSELDILRRSGAVTDWAMEQFGKLLRPGRYIQEVNHDLGKLLEIRAAEEFPLSRIDTMIISNAGPDSAYPHGACGRPGRILERGHMIINNIVFRIDGLGAENERTWSIGPPTDRLKELFAIEAKAQQDAVNACVAGNRFSDIDAAAQEVIEAAGLGDHIFHRTGHGIGLWIHEDPVNTAFDHRTMRGGEVMSVEPAIYIRGYGGVRNSDTVLVGASAPEIVTKFPKDLEVTTVG